MCGIGFSTSRLQAQFQGAAFVGSGILREHDGVDKAIVREYIRTQEEHQKKEEQIQLDY